MAEKLKITTEVIDADWKDEAEANNDDGSNESENILQFELHPLDGKLVKNSEIDRITADEVKEKIIKFQLGKFNKRGNIAHSVFKEDNVAA